MRDEVPLNEYQIKQGAIIDKYIDDKHLESLAFKKIRGGDNELIYYSDRLVTKTNQMYIIVSDDNIYFAIHAKPLPGYKFFALDDFGVDGNLISMLDKYLIL